MCRLSYWPFERNPLNIEHEVRASRLSACRKKAAIVLARAQCGHQASTRHIRMLLNGSQWPVRSSESEAIVLFISCAWWLSHRGFPRSLRMALHIGCLGPHSLLCCGANRRNFVTFPSFVKMVIPFVAANSRCNFCAYAYALVRVYERTMWHGACVCSIRHNRARERELESCLLNRFDHQHDHSEPNETN